MAEDFALLTTIHASVKRGDADVGRTELGMERRKNCKHARRNAQSGESKSFHARNECRAITNVWLALV